MKSPKIIAAALFFIVSFLIVATWFTDGILYGGAEVGLFAFNPERWFEISKYVWWDAVAPGQLIPQFITSAPLYFSFSILKSIGLSPQGIQQVFFTFMLFLMGFGMYLLSFHIFDETRKKYAFAAGIFYLFNVYILVQIWHRFLYSTIFLAAVLPLLILFWKRWICKGRPINLTIFILVNFLSVYMYGSLASIITVWVALSFISLTEAFFPWQGKTNAGKIGFRFIEGLIFWVIVNLWWLMPTFSIAPGLLPEQHTIEDNLTTLIAISRQSVMPYLLQLTNPFYLFLNQELGQIYSGFLFKAIPWIMSALVFWGLIISLKIRNFAKYSVIFVASILLAKGAASPFSYPFIFGFRHFFFLGVIRNPFEKLGIMLPIFGAVLFAIGLQAFLALGKKYLGSTGSKLILIFTLSALVGYAWPMFGGNIFGTKQFPLQVKIPESYFKADNWLKAQKTDQGIILHLPFAGKDVVTYDWSYGYHGVDQSEILFTALPSLSRVIGIKRVDDTLVSLTNVFHSPFSTDKDQLLRVLRMFNVKFIVLHKDTKWEDKVTYGDNSFLLNPIEIEKVLDNLDFLKKEKQFDFLIIYKLVDEKYQPSIFLSNDIQLVYPGNSSIVQILSETKTVGEIITPVSKIPNELVLQQARQIYIFPDKKINYFESSPSAILAKANDLFGQLVNVSNFFNDVGILPGLEATQNLIDSTKKLSYLSSPDQKADYKESIVRFFDKFSQSLTSNKIIAKNIVDVLRLHLVVLNQIGDREVSRLIEDNMIKLELIPQYKAFGQTFKFQVPIRGSYDLLVNSKDQQVIIIINGANVISKNVAIANEGSYEINYASESGVLNDDIVLRREGIGEQTLQANIVSFRKNSPVSYSGRISLDKPSFLFFAEAYHPDWHLTLTKNGKVYEEGSHFIGNLYGNAWLINELGDYDFTIEFTPQRSVKTGIIVSSVVGIFLILMNLYIDLIRRK